MLAMLRRDRKCVLAALVGTAVGRCAMCAYIDSVA